jgi:ABC-type transport system substrate-binding protein
MLMHWDKARIMLVRFALGIGVCMRGSMRVTMDLGKTGIALALLCCGLGAGAETSSKTQAEKVLRYAFEIAETGFDPAQISDYYSSTATENMFDALYRYDYLARPAKVVPNVADGMPVISDDFRTFTVKVKPGIYFSDDPAFGGKKRELTAHDFVYTFKRIFDPKTKSQSYSDVEELKLLGMDALRRDAEKPGASFNYDSEAEGLRALDRYTIQFKMQDSQPRFIYRLTEASVLGAVAREVVEKIWRQDHGAPGGYRAVQTGPVDAVVQNHVCKKPEFPRRVLRGRTTGQRRTVAGNLPPDERQAHSDCGQGGNFHH